MEGDDFRKDEFVAPETNEARRALLGFPTNEFDAAWTAILERADLKGARAKLSIHDLRGLIAAAVTAAREAFFTGPEYLGAVKGRQDFRAALTKSRADLERMRAALEDIHERVWDRNAADTEGMALHRIGRIAETALSPHPSSEGQSQ